MNMGIFKGVSEIPRIANLIFRGVKAHKSTILTAAGVAGMVGTCVVAVKCTPKASMAMDDALIDKEDKYLDEHTVPDDEDVVIPEECQKLTFFEKSKIVVKCYLPAFVLGAASIGCIIFAKRIDAANLAAITTAWSVSESKLKEYKAAAKDVVGEKKESLISQKASEEWSKKYQDVDTSKPTGVFKYGSGNILETGHGDTLLRDAYSMNLYRADTDWVAGYVADSATTIMKSEDEVTINDINDIIGLPFTRLAGDAIVMRVQNADDRVRPIFTPGTARVDGNSVPCFEVTWESDAGEAEIYGGTYVGDLNYTSHIYGH